MNGNNNSSHQKKEDSQFNNLLKKFNFIDNAIKKIVKKSDSRIIFIGVTIGVLILTILLIFINYYRNNDVDTSIVNPDREILTRSNDYSNKDNRNNSYSLDGIYLGMPTSEARQYLYDICKSSVSEKEFDRGSHTLFALKCDTPELVYTIVGSDKIFFGIKQSLLHINNAEGERVGVDFEDELFTAAVEKIVQNKSIIYGAPTASEKIISNYDTDIERLMQDDAVTIIASLLVDSRDFLFSIEDYLGKKKYSYYDYDSHKYAIIGDISFCWGSCDRKAAVTTSYIIPESEFPIDIYHKVNGLILKGQSYGIVFDIDTPYRIPVSQIIYNEDESKRLKNKGVTLDISNI